METDALKMKGKDREKIIVRTSMIGIGTNVVLAGLKAVFGLLSHSIAMVLDAVNNLSDALSSLVTIIGTRLAGRSPDRKHPLGHGRIEYISAMIVAALVLYAGMTSLVESVRKIIEPEAPDYSPWTLALLAVAVIVKLLLGRYTKQKGKKVHSSSLEASGSDAAFDALISASVLAAAVLFMTTGISAEAWVGVLISVFILKAGIGIMSETISDILGRRADESVSKEIKRILTEEPEVRGAYDLILHNYGPDRNYASVHLELPDVMTVDRVDDLTRRLEAKVYAETGVILTGVGVYAYNTGDNEAAGIRNDVQQRVMRHDWVLQVHGFRVDTEKKTMRFDVVVSFDKSPREGLAELQEELLAAYPDYQLSIVPDLDISD